MAHNKLHTKEKNMETHLTINHLAPYLPYGLKYFIDFTDGDTACWVVEGLTVDEIFIDGYDCNYDSENCKPILRPLSDLNKEINSFIGLNHFEFLEESYVNHTEDINHLKRIVNEDKRWMYSLPIYMYNHLLEHHFDVFGLIEKNLAIDINTIK